MKAKLFSQKITTKKENEDSLTALRVHKSRDSFRMLPHHNNEDVHWVPELQMSKLWIWMSKLWISAPVLLCRCYLFIVVLLCRCESTGPAGAPQFMCLPTFRQNSETELVRYLGNSTYLVFESVENCWLKWFRKHYILYNYYNINCTAEQRRFFKKIQSWNPLSKNESLFLLASIFIYNNLFLNS